MKPIYSLIILLFNCVFTFSQNSWQYYTKIADSLQLEHHYENALQNRSKALVEARMKKVDTLLFLELLKDITKNEGIISDKTQIKKGYENLQILVKKLENYGSPKRLYETYNTIFNIALEIGTLEERQVYITKSVNYQQKSKTTNSLLLVKSLENLALTQLALGKLKGSINSLEQAEEIYIKAKINNTDVLSSIYLNLADVYGYRYLKSHKKEIKYLKKALNLYEISGSTQEVIDLCQGISGFESNRGNFDQSLSYLKKSYQLFKKSQQKLKYTEQNLNKEIKYNTYLTNAYRLVDDEKQMLYHLNKNTSLAKTKSLNDNAKDLVSLGHIFVSKYYKTRDTGKALQYINDGYAFFPEKDLYNLKEEFDMYRAILYLNKKEYSMAREVLDTVSKVEGLPIFITKTVLISQIVLAIKSGNNIEARTKINTFLNRFFNVKKGTDITTFEYQNFKPNTILSDTQHFLDIAFEFEKTSEENKRIARLLYWIALQQFEANFDQNYVNDEINKIYNKICDYFYSKASTGELNVEEQHQFLVFTEKIESRFLLNTFLTNRTESNTPEIDGLVDEEQVIRAHITFLKKENLTKKSDSIEQCVFEENIKLEKINQALKNSSNRILNLINSDNSFENLQNKFIIKYKIVNNALFRVVFNNNTTTIEEIENYNRLINKVAATIAQLKNLNANTEAIKKSMEKLFDQLFIGIDLSSTKKTIYIIPDGILHYLPFELLIKDDKYLLETSTLSYASSLSFLNTPVTKKEHKQSIALFAPSYKLFAPSDAQLAVRGTPYYLEGTLKEVKAISKMFAKSDLFINEKASKMSFKKLSNDYSILHLSMHSFVNDKDSELSSLVFSDKEEDYELYISELYGLNLNADMAVLSACNTGIGELKTGKGIVSMNTAFTAAGVPSVLSSLWSAPDEATQKIMTSFYKQLKKGEPKNLALKNAKLAYLNSTEDSNFKHPYYWAGFVLTGDTSAIVSPSNSYWIYVVIALLLLMIGFFIKKRLKLNA